ncbi:MAG: hypothetical protein IKO93_11255 [Lentisphaeria bacterium]|nr:hypothetical protein [Lentisphaeria bacterium]
MRAIFINAVARKVEEVQIENKLEAFYDKIGCTMIQLVPLGGTHLAIVDEEGRLRDWKVGFRFPKSQGIDGNALIVCEDDDGDFTDAKAPVELFQICTTFLDLKKTPLPPPAFGVAIIEDLSPEGIEKARAEALRDLERHR